MKPLTLSQLRPAASLSTILGLGLMAGATVEWLMGRIPLDDLKGASTVAIVWMGMRQLHPPTNVTTTVSAATAVVNPPA